MQLNVQFIREALDCLEQYHTYGEAMREHGRGFHPTARNGASVELTMHALRSAIAACDRERAEESHG